MQRTKSISDKTLRCVRTIQRKYYTSKNWVFYKITYYSVYGTGSKVFEKRYNRRDNWDVMKVVGFDGYII